MAFLQELGGGGVGGGLIGDWRSQGVSRKDSGIRHLCYFSEKRMP